MLGLGPFNWELGFGTLVMLEPVRNVCTTIVQIKLNSCLIPRGMSPTLEPLIILSDGQVSRYQPSGSFRTLHLVGLAAGPEQARVTSRPLHEPRAQAQGSTCQLPNPNLGH